ncbi:MAG: hypothetical protein ACI4JF_04040 [Oscillospiraceae bacterium]
MFTTARKSTHKTEAVMRLLTGNNLAVNPMLDNEFKQSVIVDKRAARESTQESAAPQPAQTAPVQNDTPQAAPVYSEPAQAVPELPKEEQVTEIHISSELIAELLPSVLDRFHCCKCGKCFAEAMTDALETVPEVNVKVENSSDLQRAEEIRTKNRPSVMSALVKIAIGRRQLPVHE